MFVDVSKVDWKLSILICTWLYAGWYRIISRFLSPWLVGEPLELHLSRFMVRRFQSPIILDLFSISSVAFPSYEHWRKMNVKDQDPTSVGDFLGVSMDILSRTWQMQEMINSKQEQTYFSIIPKKVKVVCKVCNFSSFFLKKKSKIKVITKKFIQLRRRF